jgi:single-stranded-DNA-specific exonuclease
MTSTTSSSASAVTSVRALDDLSGSHLSERLFSLICERRGWSAEFLAAIDGSEHDELKDLDVMVDALEQARLATKKIAIAPDFDMDGIASGALGYAGLSELGFDVERHMPDYRRGHDLTPDDIAEIHQQWPDTQVLLTCDGGVNSADGIAAARALGWQTLVTDHHQELEPGSTADITVNPCRLDETYANRGICGAHVLYQVLEAYALKYQPYRLWNIRLLRLFAGLGTVSDVMPVLFENRQLIRDSLSIARLLRVPAPKPDGPYTSPDPDRIDIECATLLQLLRAEQDQHSEIFLAAFEGFALMLKAFAQHGKVRDVDSLDEGFYGFYIAPAMNSARRTGVAMDDCFAVFGPGDPTERLAAMHRVIANNELRKQLTIDHLNKLRSESQPLAPWVYFSDAPAGMFGLLANQLMEVTSHPVVVLPRPVDLDAPISGSGRAPGWFPIIDTLEEHGNTGIWAIGHQQACGVKLEQARLVEELAETLRDRATAAQLTALGEGGSLAGPLGDLVLGDGPDCDASLDQIEALTELVRRIETLKPFGHEFTEPIVEVRLEPAGLRVNRIGTEAQHLRLITRDGLACLWWNAAEQHGDLLVGMVADADPNDCTTLRFIGKLQLNTFRGETRLQVVLDQPLAETEVSLCA